MNDPKRSCATCVAFAEDPAQPNPECHLNPPTVTILLMPQRPSIAGGGPTLVPVTMSARTPTRRDEWCMQWQPKISLATH